MHVTNMRIMKLKIDSILGAHVCPFLMPVSQLEIIVVFFCRFSTKVCIVKY